MSDPRWSGQIVKHARRYVAGLILLGIHAGKPVLCIRCNLPVSIEDYDVDHKVALSEGGSLFDPTNWGASHSSCNRSHGGRIGNERRAQRRLREW